MHTSKTLTNIKLFNKQKFLKLYDIILMLIGFIQVLRFFKGTSTHIGCYTQTGSFSEPHSSSSIGMQCYCSSFAKSYPTVCNPTSEACQDSLSITNFWSLLKFMSIQSVMPSNHIILCCPLLLLPSIFPSIRVFYNESVLCIRWPNFRSFSFSISPSNECS